MKAPQQLQMEVVGAVSSEGRPRRGVHGGTLTSVPAIAGCRLRDHLGHVTQSPLCPLHEAWASDSRAAAFRGQERIGVRRG